MIAGLLAVAFAAPVSADKIEDGQALYREQCKICHDAGSANGEYTPMDLIQDQWRRFFDRKYVRTHKDVIDEKHGGKPVTETITPEQLELIENFTIDTTTTDPGNQLMAVSHRYQGAPPDTVAVDITGRTIFPQWVIRYEE